MRGTTAGSPTLAFIEGRERGGAAQLPLSPSSLAHRAIELTGSRRRARALLAEALRELDRPGR